MGWLRVRFEATNVHMYRVQQVGRIALDGSIDVARIQKTAFFALDAGQHTGRMQAERNATNSVILGHIAHVLARVGR